MCTVCGCGADEVKIEGGAHTHPTFMKTAPCMRTAMIMRIPTSMPAAVIWTTVTGPARAHAPGMSQARMVQVEQDILAKNNIYAAANRQWFDERGILALNLVSSPGSGKTSCFAGH
jgi:hydrogenase nickel incorporation protein HypB